MPEKGGTIRTEPSSRKYSTDYRLYLEETFNEFRDSFMSIKENQDKFNAKLDEVAKQTTEVVKQTTITNSRVTHLEEYKVKADAIIESRVTPKMFCDLVECLNKTGDRIQHIDDDLTEYRTIKKYPKLSLVLLGVLLIGIAISAIGAIRSIGVDIRDKDMNSRIEKIEQDIGEINKKLNGDV